MQGDTITVSGFDYSDDANWCGPRTTAQGTTYGGRKLVITFTVTPKDGFLGGNGVPTNGDASGVYDKDGNVVEKFVVPTVNVPIDIVEVKVAVEVKDINTYLLNSLTTADLMAKATATCGEGANVVTLDLTKTNANYGLADWQTKFVTISHALTHGEGNNTLVPEQGLTNLTEDDTFKLTVTVAPDPNTEASVIGKQAEEQSGFDEANIKVFKPELTFKDSTVYLGAAVPTPEQFTANNKAGEIWKHNGVVAVPANMTGEKPTLALTCTPDTNAIQNGKIAVETDIPVKVDVKIGETNVNEHTTFKHDACAEVGCTWATIGSENGNPAFLLHVKSGTLTIEKTGGASGESYVFTVTYTDPWSEQTKVTLHEAVQGNGSKTIVGLPIGEYTVAEQTDWSWRYGTTTISGGGKATLSAGQLEAEVTVTNSGRSGKWLSAEDSVINRWVDSVVKVITAGASQGTN